MARKKVNPDEQANNDVEVTDMGEQASNVNEVVDSANEDAPFSADIPDGEDAVDSSESTEDIAALEALLDAEDEAGQDEDFLEPEPSDDYEDDEAEPAI